MVCRAERSSPKPRLGCIVCVHSRLADTAALKIAAEASSAIRVLGKTAEIAEVTVIKAPNRGGMIVVGPGLEAWLVVNNASNIDVDHDDMVHRFNNRLI